MTSRMIRATSRLTLAFAGSLAVLALSAQSQSTLPAISLDEFLNTTEITSARLSPDGAAAVIGTEEPDWKANNFRHLLWLWTAKDGLHPLTQSGTDEDPQWSPDGKWIAFLSDRSVSQSQDSASDDANSGDAKQPSRSGPRADKDSDEKTTRIWLIPIAGGEAQPLYREKLDAHTFAWSSDGKIIYLATTQPLTHEQESTHKDEWKDVIRWREQERGDLLLALPVAASLANTSAVLPAHSAEKTEAGKLPLPAGTQSLNTGTASRLAIAEIAPSPDGKLIAFVTDSISHRMENPADTEIYVVPIAGGETRQLTHNEALESSLHWSPDSKWLHLAVKAAGGNLEGKYRDVQGRLYRLNPQASDPKPERLGPDFDGSFEDYTFLPNGDLLAQGLRGTEEQLYQVSGQKTTKLPGQSGSYSGISSSNKSSALLVRLSSINHPTQVYLASDPKHPDKLTALTRFNPIFAQRAQPEWQPYSWKSPDGHTVEGVLIFPPGKKDSKHLRMLIFIHGGPADADGNRFGADWYDYATLAATQGWLVFRPNYRGSSGYGDEFMLQIAPHLVSVPGADILSGVDALVKDGYADPDRLAIGGYSYGGYMTNWLITETSRFKAAVTGAGAVEHAANWGNDDVTWDDAWYLSGKPWETPATYQSEAALFRMNRVKTPTHIVQGNSDVRVSYLEGVTLERALQQLGIDHSFLVFPGEGHNLGHNPWHGYIKLREELKWLDKYVPSGK